MLLTLSKEKVDNTFIETLRYVLVSGAAFALDILVLAVLVEYLNIYYLISAAIAFFTGMVAKYIFCIYWVFYKRILKNWKMEFAIFGLIGVIGLGLNHVIIWFFTEHVRLYYIFSKLISTAVVFWWNFIVRKYLLFR